MRRCRLNTVLVPQLWGLRFSSTGCQVFSYGSEQLLHPYACLGRRDKDFASVEGSVGFDVSIGNLLLLPGRCGLF